MEGRVARHLVSVHRLLGGVRLPFSQSMTKQAARLPAWLHMHAAVLLPAVLTAVPELMLSVFALISLPLLLCCPSALLWCREPASNLADNLLRDFEQRWWGAVKKVRPGHARTHACYFDAVQSKACNCMLAITRVTATCSVWHAVLTALHFTAVVLTLCCALCCAAVAAAATALQGDEEAINSMMAVGGDVLARTGVCLCVECAPGHCPGSCCAVPLQTRSLPLVHAAHCAR